jgi:hypothetical protein
LASGALALQRFEQLENMNLNDLANLGQIIGAVAVVISLFYGRTPTLFDRPRRRQTLFVCAYLSVVG